MCLTITLLDKCYGLCALWVGPCGLRLYMPAVMATCSQPPQFEASLGATNRATDLCLMPTGLASKLLESFSLTAIQDPSLAILGLPVATAQVLMENIAPNDWFLGHDSFYWIPQAACCTQPQCPNSISQNNLSKITNYARFISLQQ